MRAEIERLIKSICNKQDALSHFYIKRELTQFNFMFTGFMLLVT